MSALVNLPPDVPQDMELEDVVELLIPGNNMESSVIIQCEYCGEKKSPDTSQLMFSEHVKKHQNPKEKCDLCGKTIGTQHQVKRHKKMVHSSRVKCKVVEKTGKGLQEGSEEVVEATHSKFDKFWARYKVKDLEDPQHGENLLACTTDFNSTNI